MSDLLMNITKDTIWIKSLKIAFKWIWSDETLNEILGILYSVYPQWRQNNASKEQELFFCVIKNEIQLYHKCTGGISQQNGSVLVFMISFSNLILLSRRLGYLLMRKFHILKTSWFPSHRGLSFNILPNYYLHIWCFTDDRLKINPNYYRT